MRNLQSRSLNKRRAVKREGAVLYYRRMIFKSPCVYCGELVKAGSSKRSSQRTLEHILPRCLGGTKCWMNSAMACGSCNNDKGDQSLLEFYLNGKQRASKDQRVELQRVEGLICLDAVSKFTTAWHDPLFSLLKS